MQEAQSWIGTPFHPGACVKGIGVDCGRFCLAVYAALGVRMPPLDSLPYFPQGWFLHRTSEDYLALVERYAQRSPCPLPGALAMFRLGRIWAHTAIIVRWPEIIHASDRGVQSADAQKLPRVGRQPLFLDPLS